MSPFGSSATTRARLRPGDGTEEGPEPGRSAVRHGHEAGEVTLGGRRLAVERPRVRSAGGRAGRLGGRGIGAVDVALGCLAEPCRAHPPRARRGRQDPARALGREHRECDPRDGAALGPGRARPRARAGDPVRARRRQCAPEGDPQRLRRGAGAAVCAAQRAQCARPPARARPAAGEAAAATGVGARRSHARTRPTPPTRQRARANVPRRPDRCAKASKRH